MLIEIFRSKSYFVIPIYCKRIEFKGLKIFRIRQLPTDTLIKQRCKIKQPLLTITKRKK